MLDAFMDCFSQSWWIILIVLTIYALDKRAKHKEEKINDRRISRSYERFSTRL